jgi:hypothetical protein
MRVTSVHSWVSSGEGPGGAWPTGPHPRIFHWPKWIDAAGSCTKDRTVGIADHGRLCEVTWFGLGYPC